MNLANTVLKSRINKGFSQDELAERIGTKQANISRIEAGLANPTLNLIKRLIKVLDIDISFSCNESPEYNFQSFLNSETTVFEISNDWIDFSKDTLDYEFKTDENIFSKVYELA